MSRKKIVEVLGHQLKAEFLKAKDFADKNPVRVPANIPTVVHANVAVTPEA
jgi:hypothetical protein